MKEETRKLGELLAMAVEMAEVTGGEIEFKLSFEKRAQAEAEEIPVAAGPCFTSGPHVHADGRCPNKP